MKRHIRGESKPHPPGAIEFCIVCGAIRVWAIPGYQSSGWKLNGQKQPFCPVEADRKVLE